MDEGEKTYRAVGQRVKTLGSSSSQQRGRSQSELSELHCVCVFEMEEVWEKLREAQDF